jgi:hypothetical protein
VAANARFGLSQIHLGCFAGSNDGIERYLDVVDGLGKALKRQQRYGLLV